MPTIGPTDRPEVFEWNENQRNQQVNRLTTPERLRLTHVGAWVRGVQGYGDVSYRLCIWNPSSGALLGQSSLYDVSPANIGTGNLVNVERPLATPVELDEGEDVYVGIAWSPNGALQTGWHDHGSLPAHRDRSTSSIPANMAASNSDPHTAGPIAVYVSDYEPIAGAWVQRGGSVGRADSVSVYRGGSWSEAESVRTFRGGNWTDAD